jgi:hypothetical protein
MAGVSAQAQDQESIQPYIDRIKKDMENANPNPAQTPTDETPDPYLQSIKKKLKPPSGESYIDAVKKANPDRFNQNEPSYTEQERAKLPPKDPSGAIAALKEGRSKLHAKKEGTPSNRFGFNFNAAPGRTITGNSNVTANPFDTIYGSPSLFRPDLTFSFEHLFFNSRTAGSLGILTQGGFTYYSGFGQFAIPLVQGGTACYGAMNCSFFPLTSNVGFRFYEIPVTVAPMYRFEFSDYVKPFVNAGPTVIGYIENRNDGLSANHGLSTAITASVGVDLQMDWMSSEASWSLYEEYKILHSYFTIQYTHVSAVGSAVSFNQSGVYLGVSFEY